MTDIDQIIERLEKSAGPDRELNELIGETVLGFERCTLSGCGGVHDADNYTGTIDAALKLIPEGWGIASLLNCILDTKYSDIRATSWQATLAKIGDTFVSSSDFGRIPMAAAPSAPLAICIAALKGRARAHKGE